MRPRWTSAPGGPAASAKCRRAPRRSFDQHAGSLAADPGDVALDRAEQRAQRRDLPGLEVDEDGGVEDADERVGRRLGDQLRQEAERVAAADVHRVLASDLERRREPRLASRLVGPEAGAQPAGVGGVGGVDGREVDAGPPRHRRRVERRDVRADQLAFDRQRRRGNPGGPAAVVIGEVVPAQIQPRARPDLDQRERAPVGDRRERRQQAPAARHLVRLRAPERERGGERGGAVGAEGGEGLREARPWPVPAQRGVVGRQRVGRIAQQLVVDRREEHHRGLLRGSRREGEQVGRFRDQRAQLPVERRLGGHVATEGAEVAGERGEVHRLAR